VIRTDRRRRLSRTTRGASRYRAAVLQHCETRLMETANSMFFGRTGPFRSAGTEATLHFSLDVAAQSFRNDAGSAKFAKVGDRELGQIRKNRGKRRGRLAKNRDANVVGDGPLTVMNDRGNDRSRKFFARKSFQDLRFG